MQKAATGEQPNSQAINGAISVRQGWDTACTCTHIQEALLLIRLHLVVVPASPPHTCDSEIRIKWIVATGSDLWRSSPPTLLPKQDHTE